jgi:glycosyltransferase involved in cell wall biosynthesis
LASWLAKNARHYQIVHIHLCRDFVTAIALLRLRKVSTPIVVQTHGMLTRADNWASKLYDRVLLSRLIGRPQVWLYLTDYEKRDLLQLGVPEGRLHPIANSVQIGGTNRQPLEPNFAYISRYEKRKQPDVFVAAALRLLEAGVKANFVMAGPDEGMLLELQAMIQRSEFRDRFDIRTAVSRDVVQDLLGSVTALVLPSTAEPYPMIALEALSHGTPLVLSRQTGISSLVEEARAALVVDPSVQEVADAMLTLMERPELRQALAYRGRAAVERWWSLDRLGNELMREYSALLGSRATDD